VLDPELIKQITIKDFDHFMNHRTQIDPEIDPLFSRNLFAIRDNKWRTMRSTLSPAFTGSKMRLMFQFMAECTMGHMDNIMQSVNKQPLEVETKELFQRFGNDIIATCSFGIKIDSLTDKTNEFYTHGKRVTNLEGFNGLKFLGFTGFPKLMKLLKLKIIDDEAKLFFQNIVQSNIKYREENKVVRHDMINLLIQMKKNEVVEETEKSYDNAGFATVHEELQASKDELEQISKGSKNCLLVYTSFGSFRMGGQRPDRPVFDILFRWFRHGFHSDVIRRL
jgi:cytochrome P450 family 9